MGRFILRQIFKKFDVLRCFATSLFCDFSTVFVCVFVLERTLATSCSVQFASMQTVICEQQQNNQNKNSVYTQ